MKSIFKLSGSMLAVMAFALMFHGGGATQTAARDRSQETNICGVDICTSNFQCITACGEPATCVTAEHGAGPKAGPAERHCVID